MIQLYYYTYIGLCVLIACLVNPYKYLVIFYLHEVHEVQYSHIGDVQEERNFIYIYMKWGKV